MPVRPSKLWKDMSPEARLAAAAAFWQDDSTPGEVNAQQVEVVMALARRLNFRPKSIQALPVERRAKHLAQINEVSDGVATRALIAYHLAAQRPLMGAFLDAVGIAHEDGVITAEDVKAPDAEHLAAGVKSLQASFPADDVALYLNTLVAVDGDTWGGIDPFLSPTP